MGNKGGRFERDMARAFSLWWSKGKHDDLIWRTSQSGGRGTTRRKSGKRTFGQHSDLCSTHPSTRRLFDLVVVELKKGYTETRARGKKTARVGFTMSDCFDQPGNSVSGWNGWCLKAWEDARAADVHFWLLVHRRTRRLATVTMPNGLYQLFRDAGVPSIRPAMVLHPPGGKEGVISLHLDVFLSKVRQEHFREALNILSVAPWRYITSPEPLKVKVRKIV